MRSKILKAKGGATEWFSMLGYRQWKIVVNFFFTITLEFLCQHNGPKFLENHAHVT